MRILVYQTAFLGDLILTSPLIKSLKRSFPSAEITLVVRKGLEETFLGYDYLRVIPSNKESPFKFSKFLRKFSFDLAVSPHRSHRTSLTLFFSKIPRRIGFKTAGFSFLYTDTVPHEFKKGLHEVDRNLKLLKPLEKEYEILYEREPELVVKEEEVERAFKKFSLKRPYAVLAPGSVWPTKAWLPEYYGEVARFLISKGYQVVIVGARADSKYCEKAWEESGKRALNLCGKTGLREFFSIVKGAEFVVSNDSSPVHVAVSVKTPVLEIYGSTVPEFGFYPFGFGKFVELKTLKCRPCGVHGKKKCPEGHFKCMVELKPEIVIEELKEFM